jgi:predicted phage terminase large subunit-like protein
LRVTPTYRWDWAHLRHIRQALQHVTSGACTRLMLFVPPRHGKTEMTTVRYPVYRLERDPALRVIIGAYNQTLANTFSRKARRIAQERLTLAGDRSAVEQWETSQGGGLRAVGVGGGITGQGGNLVIIDDPVKSREEAESQAYRDRVWDWYRDDLYTRLEPDGAIILIQTRWHEDDLAGRILSSPKASDWTVVSLPALAEDADPLEREPGAALCPERYDEAALFDIKGTLGSYGFTALYQQRPSPAEGGLLPRAWWQYYTRPPARYDELLQSWDMTFKDSKNTDYVVGQVWGRVGADCYLLDQVRARMDFPTTVQAVRTLSARWPEARAKLIEDKANGPAVIATLRREISGLIPVEPQGGKAARVAAVSPVIEARNVWLPQEAPWVGDFVEECAAFPNGRYDDQVDAMSQALLRLTARPDPRAQRRYTSTGGVTL